MLKKANRIGKKDFPGVMKNSISRFSNLFSFRGITKLKPEGPDKFSVVVSKKISKNATDRNLIRRRIYNAIKEIIKKDNIKFKGSAIFFAKKDVLGVSFSEIKSEVGRLLNM